VTNIVAVRNSVNALYRYTPHLCKFQGCSYKT